MTGGELVALARGAGFSQTQARTMAAIALAESGGNPGAVGDQSLANATWGPSIGLWQIRSLNAQRGTGKERDATRLTDPTFNARAARIIFGQQGFGAWSVYSSGSYKSKLAALDASGQSGIPLLYNPSLPAGKDGNGSPTPGGVLGLDPTTAVGGAVAGAGGGLLTGLDAVGGFFATLGKRGTWVRVLQVVGGTGMVVSGLLLLGRDTVMQAASGVADVVPVGKALKTGAALTKTASKTAGKTAGAAAAATKGAVK